MIFYSIRTGKRFSGKIPKAFKLPIQKENPPRTILILYKEGQEDWEKALKRYMFLKGFIGR